MRTVAVWDGAVVTAGMAGIVAVAVTSEFIADVPVVPEFTVDVSATSTGVGHVSVFVLAAVEPARVPGGGHGGGGHGGGHRR